MIFLRTYKRIAIALLVVLVLLLAASQLLTKMVDADAALEPLRRQVHELTGQPLITETISVSVLGGPRIEIQGVALRSLNETREPYVLYADKMVIELDLFELLDGAPEVETLELSGLRIYLEKGRRGQTNWQFLDEMKQQVSHGQALTIRVKNGSLRYVDIADDKQFDAQRINGEVELSSEAVALDLQAMFMQQTARLSARCKMDHFTHVNNFDTSCLAKLQGSGISLDADQRLVMQNGAMQMRGSLSVDTDDARLWGDALFAQQKQSLQGYLALPVPLKMRAELYRDATQVIANVTQFEMEQTIGKASIAEKMVDGTPQLTVKAIFERLDFDMLKALIRDAAGTKADLLASQDGFNKAREGTLSLSAKRVDYNHLPITDLQVAGRFSGGEIIVSSAQGSLPGQGAMTTLGRVAPTSSGIRYEGVVEASGEQLYALLPLVDMQATPAAKQTLRQYRARMNASVSPIATILSDVRIIAGDQLRIAGGVTIDNAGQRALSAALSIENLNVSPFEKEWLQGHSLLSDPGAMTPGSSPFGFTWLSAVSRPMQWQLQLKNYTLFGAEGKLARFRLSTKQGELAFNDLQAGLGQSNLQGNVAIRYNQNMPRPSVNGKLRLDRLDADNALREHLWQENAPADGSIWSTGALNLNPLKHVDGQMSLSIGSLTHEAFEASNLQLEVELQDALLNLRDWQMQIWDGQWSGTLNLDARTLPSLQMQYQTAGTDIRQLMQDWVQYDHFSGSAALSGKMATNGVSAAEWVERLNGGLSFDARGVVVRQFNLPAIVRAISAARSVSTLPNTIRLAFDSGTTRFEQIKGVTYFEQGTLKTTQIQLRSPESTGQLQLAWDLADWTLDARLDLALTALGARTPPVFSMLFDGPFTLPVRQLNLTSVESYLAQKRR